jgi:hypothetical protein
MRKLFLVVLLLILCVGLARSAYETYFGRDADGNTYTKLKNTSVIAPYPYWCWTISPLGKGNFGATGGGGPTTYNKDRYQTHHRMIVGGSYVPIARIDLSHTNTGTDTIDVKIWYGAVSDSVKFISASIQTITFPVTGDSACFAPRQLSAAGDWYLTTYFER